MYSDVVPDNTSWLASNGSYNARAVYPDYYIWLNSKIGQVITANGGQVVLSTDTITNYDFVVNTADETFRLPLLSGSEDLPGGTYEIVNITSTSQTYTAPKNGFIDFQGVLSTANGHADVYTSNPPRGFRIFGPSVTAAPLANLFVKKGSIVSFKGNIDFTANGTRVSFLPAVGNGTLYYYVGESRNTKYYIKY